MDDRREDMITTIDLFDLTSGVRTNKRLPHRTKTKDKMNLVCKGLVKPETRNESRD